MYHTQNVKFDSINDVKRKLTILQERWIDLLPATLMLQKQTHAVEFENASPNGKYIHSVLCPNFINLFCLNTEQALEGLKFLLSQLKPARSKTTLDDRLKSIILIADVRHAFDL